MLKVLIFERQMQLADQVENILDKVCKESEIRKTVDIFCDEKELRNGIFVNGKYDIAIFCIHETVEVDVATYLREYDEDILMIFLAESDKYLKNIVCLNAFAYIDTPIDETMLESIFRKAYHKILDDHKYFFFCYNKEEFKILTKDILYFESRGRQVRVYITNGEIKVFNGKLKEVEKILEEGEIPFVRIHQSFLVNYYSIKSRLKKEVRLMNGMTLPISESKQKMLGENHKNINGY